MSHSFYHFHIFTDDFKQEFEKFLSPDFNLENPQVIDLRKLSIKEQQTAIALVEDFFSTQNISPHFPYPVYVLTELLEKFVVSTFKRENDLPKFFPKRHIKMGLKETHLSDKNTLLQRELKNSDTLNNNITIKNFASAHQKIFFRERERNFYESILESLKRR